MKFSKTFMTALAMLPLATLDPSPAEAGQRCKTYTKTIKIDGHREIGYGKACQLKNGQWEVVKISGSYEGRDYIKHYIADDLYDRGYELAEYNSPGTRHNDGYHNARYYNGYPYNQPRNYGQYKKHHKHSDKHKSRVSYRNDKKCSTRH